MYIQYNDILSRIEARPNWWLNGVPRYLPFSPEHTDVYAREAALVHVKCNCGQDYLVGVFSRTKGKLEENLNKYYRIRVGDPPNACCGVDASMSSHEIRILEFWKQGLDREKLWAWTRIPDLELVLSD